jgi:N-acetylmuramoyl-L-alanine amidase
MMKRSVGLVCLAFMLACVTHAAAAVRTLVERIRYVGTVSYSRVVIDLSRPSTYRVQLVPADAQAEAPIRVVLDVDGAKIGVEAKEPLNVGDALLRRIRTGQFSDETARVVLDLARDANYRVFSLPDPYRLVIDLRTDAAVASIPEIVHRGGTAANDAAKPSEPGSASRPALPRDPPAATASRPPASTPVSPPVVASRGRVALPAQAGPRRYKVMLDPGHGGKDPGARGVGGIYEKDVVLSISRLVEARLREDPTVDVHLTRRDDRYLTLEERTALANAVGADLFISIHANASPNRSAHGIEVYYLNNTNNRGTLRLAAMENDVRWNPDDPSLQSAIPDLSYILSDLRQTYKVEESKLLAQGLVGSMAESARASFPGVQGLGAKEGPFYVLVGAYMPCVLVETSFLTHPVEGARLKTLAYREALADGIFQGIRSYLQQTSIARTL